MVWFPSVYYIKENSFSFRWTQTRWNPFSISFEWTQLGGRTFLNSYRMRVFHIFFFSFLLHRIKVVWKTTCDLANKRIEPENWIRIQNTNIHICTNIMYKCIWYAISKSFYYKMVAEIECFCILKLLICRIQSKNGAQNKRIQIDRGK